MMIIPARLSLVQLPPQGCPPGSWFKSRQDGGSTLENRGEPGGCAGPGRYSRTGASGSPGRLPGTPFAHGNAPRYSGRPKPAPNHANWEAKANSAGVSPVCRKTTVSSFLSKLLCHFHESLYVRQHTQSGLCAPPIAYGRLPCPRNSSTSAWTWACCSSLVASMSFT